MCLAANDHPRIGSKLTRKAFLNEGHISVVSAATGHVIVDKVLAQHKIQRRIVLRVPSYLGVARILAQTDLLVIVAPIIRPKPWPAKIASSSWSRPWRCPATPSSNTGMSALTEMLATCGCV